VAGYVGHIRGDLLDLPGIDAFPQNIQEGEIAW
jgi:hypothetical protein